MNFDLGALLFTPPAAGGQQPQALQGQALGGNGLFTAPGLAFFDLLFAAPAQSAAEAPGNGGAAETGADPQLLPLLLLHKVVRPEGKTTGSGSDDGDTPVLSAPDYTGHGEPLPAGEAVAADAETPAPVKKIVLPNGMEIVLPAQLPPQAAAQPVSAENPLLPQPEGLNADPLPAGVPEENPVLPAPALNKFAAFLEHLLAGIPAESRPDIAAIAPGLLRKALPAQPALQFDPAPDSGETPAPALIAANMTPEEITKFLEELSERTQGGESFIVGLVKILPPKAAEASGREAIFFPRALIVPQQPKTPGVTAAAPVENTNAPAETLPADALLPVEGGGEAETAARLNSLSVGEDLAFPEFPETGFEKVLKVLEQAQQPRAAQPDAPVPEKNSGNPAKIASPGLSTVQAHTVPALGLEFTAATCGDIWPDGHDWTRHPAGAVQALTLNGPAMMTSLVSHVPQAGQPHPAVQIVASAITKHAGNGETKNITMRLEPPELGRIEVRMEFTKDKTLKTHMLVEKQETFLMLQRDAHVLERALQDGGIDLDGGMSFELAQDNLFDHGHDGGKSGGNGAGGGEGGSGTEDAGEEIIETTMTWHVDPETGLTHYDILA